MSKSEYWNKCVRTKEDVEQYYSIYYPEYPTELCKAIALRITEVLDKARNGKELTDDEKKLFEEKKEEYSWDWMAEVKEQETQGKISLACKRMEELLK